MLVIDTKIFFYIGFLILGFGLCFKVLQSSRLDEFFKQGHTTYIRLAYFLISLIGGHLLAEIGMNLISFFPLPSIWLLKT